MDQNQWQRHVAAFKDSGISARAYCTQHSLVYHRFLYWYRKLCKDEASNEGFAAVKVAPDASSPAALGVVEFPSGARLIIHSTELLTMLPRWLSP